ncbi:glutamine synthetase family protein [Ferrovibrio sp.]|uniref:glutamine synthetase family protein n=1 Tax=Ferrovibrio sp. TaxID=1917215 RepID=UPI00345D5B7E
MLYEWDVADKVFGAGPFVGEAISLDTESVRHYPFEAKAAWILADYAGPSLAYSPRALLARQIEAAAGMGLQVQAGFEFEWLVFDETPESLRAKNYTNLTPWAPDNRCWDALSASIHAGLIYDLQETLNAAEVSLENLGMELGPGCIEATLAATDAMRAADDALFFKQVTRAFFRRHNLSACFMAQTDISTPGLSGHIHLSLHDAAGNALFRNKDTRAVSQAARWFIGGVLKLLPEFLVLPLHTVNSYRRLSPGNWAPRTATWSLENYSTAIRAVSGDHDAARLEFRTPGSDVNPYLGMAMFLAAGLWGLREKIEPPQPVQGDGRLEIPVGMQTLPHDLLLALQAFECSAMAKDLLGEEFVAHFVQSRRNESDALRRAVSATERARYFEYV